MVNKLVIRVQCGRQNGATFETMIFTKSAFAALTYTDAGKIAGVSKTTIGKWVDLGVLSAASMPGSRNKRIRRSTLIAFLTSLECEGSTGSVTKGNRVCTSRKKTK